ncbi:uncharacterized protein V1518DRAFT_425515 [Limtongia smithiae]|uniref:uncharacterized protein n=1 Tax=Limtongia smithiae TaxID=1125753 RepID=UPI0034CE9F15
MARRVRLETVVRKRKATTVRHQQRRAGEITSYAGPNPPTTAPPLPFLAAVGAWVISLLTPTSILAILTKPTPLPELYPGAKWNQPPPCLPAPTDPSGQRYMRALDIWSDGDVATSLVSCVQAEGFTLFSSDSDSKRGMWTPLALHVLISYILTTATSARIFTTTPSSAVVSSSSGLRVSKLAVYTRHVLELSASTPYKAPFETAALDPLALESMALGLPDVAYLLKIVLMLLPDGGMVGTVRGWRDLVRASAAGQRVMRAARARAMADAIATLGGGRHRLVAAVCAMLAVLIRRGAATTAAVIAEEAAVAHVFGPIILGSKVDDIAAAYRLRPRLVFSVTAAGGATTRTQNTNQARLLNSIDFQELVYDEARVVVQSILNEWEGIMENLDDLFVPA